MESNHWSDIAYNFLLGGDGLAYVGRDWDFEGAHTFHYNNISIGVSFIGNFDDVMPTKNQLEAAKKLLELGVELGKISEDYILLGQRQVAQTLSPGDALYHIIKTWPHWSSVISKPGEPIRPDVPGMLIRMALIYIVQKISNLLFSSPPLFAQENHLL